MKSRRTVTLFLALATILVLLCGTALAGIEPVPWRTVIENRTDRLDPASTFYNQPMSGMELIVRVGGTSTYDGAGGTTEIVITIPIKDAAGGNLILAPGQTLAFAVDQDFINRNFPSGGTILSWSFTAKMGVDPVPWRPVFAFETKLGQPPDPWQPPSLAPSYLTGEMPILGFASPGVLVGTVALVNDEMFYDFCPSVPPAGSAWKNHGHYVRCIAQQADDLVFTGRITPDEADAIVSAAAQSETGKK